jgi:type I restriction enzyme M protein
MNTIAEIVQKLGLSAKQLYQEGIPYHAYLTELTWLWLLKIMPIIKPGDSLLTYWNWETLTQQHGWQQLKYYQEIISALGQINDADIAGIYAHARTVLQQPEQLTAIISALNNFDEATPADWGEIYEMLLEEGSHQQGCYLRVAPRSLVDLMIILTQPQSGELIQDPLAGTASFIVAAAQYVQVTSEEEDYESNRSETSHFIAIEPDLTRQRLALMNCLLHQINLSSSVSVQWGDSLLANREAWPLADVIFSMLVFTNDPNHHELGKQDSSLALLQHIYQTLKPGGRAAVILADNVLNSAGPAQQARTTLLNTCVLHTVLRLPQGIFYPHKIPAHVLFFRRAQSNQEQTEQVWFYDARTQFPTFGQYLRLSRRHLRDFESAYGDDPLGQSARYDEGEGKRWRCFSRDALAKQGDRLDWCWSSAEPPGLDHRVSSPDIGEVLDETVAELEFLTTLLRS